LGIEFLIELDVSQRNRARFIVRVRHACKCERERQRKREISSQVFWRSDPGTKPMRDC
jgi:hypothetical protein